MTANHPTSRSERQRVIVLTFPSPEDAQAWDDAGQPLGDIVLSEARDRTVVVERPGR